MTIDKSFIDRVAELAAVEVKDIGGRSFATKTLHLVEDPEVAKINMHTLTGLVDFIPTIAEGGQLIVHVEDYNMVYIRSEVFGPNKQRESHALAKSYDLKHKFDQHMPVEEFVVYLQAMFVQDETTAAIMKIVGNLSQGSELNAADDGMTQRVTAKVGVTKVEQVPLPNPVTLRPYRTFADVQQPESKFILRIKGDKDRGPQCALYEADGGAWRNTAIATIKAWLVGATARMTGIHIVA